MQMRNLQLTFSNFLIHEEIGKLGEINAVGFSYFWADALLKGTVR